MALTSIFALLLAETVVTGVPAYDLHTFGKEPDVIDADDRMT